MRLCSDLRSTIHLTTCRGRRILVIYYVKKYVNRKINPSYCTDYDKTYISSYKSPQYHGFVISNPNTGTQLGGFKYSSFSFSNNYDVRIKRFFDLLTLVSYNAYIGRIKPPYSLKIPVRYFPTSSTASFVNSLILSNSLFLIRSPFTIQLPPQHKIFSYSR